LLNHGLHAPRLEYRDSGDAWLLLGTRYSLLRPEFEPWRGRERIIPKQAKKILITLGGADAKNVTACVLNAMPLLGDLALEIRVLAGPLNSRLAELGRITATMPNVELCIDVTDPAPLMAWADIAVAAAGTTAWELAFMQAPAILLVLAANQFPVARGLDAFGAVQSLGSADGLTSGAIAAALRDLIHDVPRRQRMADSARILVDGMGAARVLSAMRQRERRLFDSELTIRHASFEDELLLWQWANDPVTRRNSFTSGPISWDEHQAWCARKHASPDCRFWIMCAGELPVGQIRYERRGGNTAEMSFSVAPGFRSNGLGTRLLQATFDLAARELGVRWIEGAALVQNGASRRAFLNAGFVAAEEKMISGKACVIFRRPCAAPALKNDHVSCH
jgi:RimJ/RimL family protein N-acetyltransferase